MGNNNCARACKREPPPQSNMEQPYTKVTTDDHHEHHDQDARHDQKKQRAKPKHCLSCLLLFFSVLAIGGGIFWNLDVFTLYYRWIADSRTSEKPVKTTCAVVAVGLEKGTKVDGACEPYGKYFSPDKRNSKEKCEFNGVAQPWRNVKGVPLKVAAPATSLSKTDKISARRLHANNASNAEQITRRLRAKNDRKLASDDCYEIPWAVVTLATINPASTQASMSCAYPIGWGIGESSDVGGAGFPTKPISAECYVWKGGIALSSKTVGDWPLPQEFPLAFLPLLKFLVIPVGMILLLLSCCLCCCGR